MADPPRGPQQRYEQLRQVGRSQWPPQDDIVPALGRAAARLRSAGAPVPEDFWKELAVRASCRCPSTIAGGVNDLASAGALWCLSTPEETRALLQEVPVAYRTADQRGACWRRWRGRFAAGPARRSAASTSRGTGARSCSRTWTCRARWAGSPACSRCGSRRRQDLGRGGLWVGQGAAAAGAASGARLWPAAVSLPRRTDATTAGGRGNRGGEFQLSRPVRPTAARDGARRRGAGVAWSSREPSPRPPSLLARCCRRYRRRPAACDVDVQPRPAPAVGLSRAWHRGSSKRSGR